MLSRLLTIGILLTLIFIGCKSTSSTDTTPVRATLPKAPKFLTVFLVDRSASFHKIQKQGKFQGKNYFYIACDQIKEYVEKQADRENELILVRIIQSSSFSDDTFIARIDFTNQPNFNEPEPTGPYSKVEKDEWKKRKNKFLEDVKDKQSPLVKEFNTEIDKLRKMDSSGETDLVNAFKALIPDLKGLPDYAKRIIVYSDFKDTQTKVESAAEIDLGNETEVEGRFVSMNELTPDSYDALLKAWKKLLKCKSKKFKTPGESI